MSYKKFKDYRLGEEKLQKCGLKAKITEYRLAGDMTVQFEDGKIVDYVDYYTFVNRKSELQQNRPRTKR